MSLTTDAFWKGKFGDDYTARNTGRVEANAAFFRRALAKVNMRHVETVIELGCGAGENLLALRSVWPSLRCTGLEINAKAASAAIDARAGLIYNRSFFEGALPEHDLAFTKGVLIHVPPTDIQRAYRRLVSLARRYVLVAEYHNPTPVEVLYRGQAGRMWKRDFAGELLDNFRLRVVDYGFAWSRDAQPQDDLVWTLFEKE